jgi:cyanate permease
MDIYCQSCPAFQTRQLKVHNADASAQAKGEPLVQSYRWVMLALVWLPYAAFGLVSRSIAPLVTPILSDLHISYSEMGLVLGSWQLTYIVVGILAGSITDRLGVRKAVFAGALIIVASACLRYFVTGFFPLLLTVALFGAGAPLISIGAPTVAAQWFSGRGRGVAVGIYTTSPSVGGLVALAATNSLVMPLVGFSWRWTFVFFGAVTLAIALIWILLARDARHPVLVTRQSTKQTFLSLIRVPYVRIIFIGGLLAFATSHGMSNWLPNLFESQGLSAAESGFLASIPMFSGIFSVLLVPTLTPARYRAKAIAAAAAGNVISLVLLATVSGPLTLAGLVLFGLAGFAIFPMLMLMLMDSPEVGVGTMGLASGVFFAVAEIGGFSGPLLMGTLFDMTGTFLTGVLFLAALNLAITAMTLFLRRGSAKAESAA